MIRAERSVEFVLLVFSSIDLSRIIFTFAYVITSTYVLAYTQNDGSTFNQAVKYLENEKMTKKLWIRAQ